MKKIQAWGDATAISLSFLCAIHCFVLPLLLVFLPSVIALELENESFHWWMLLAVLPTSAYALTVGCREHKRYRVLFVGGAGLLILCAAVLLGEPMLGETGEKLLTLCGSCLVASGHLLNFFLCRKRPDCACEPSA